MPQLLMAAGTYSKRSYRVVTSGSRGAECPSRDRFSPTRRQRCDKEARFLRSVLFVGKCPLARGEDLQNSVHIEYTAAPGPAADILQGGPQPRLIGQRGVGGKFVARGARGQDTSSFVRA